MVMKYIFTKNQLNFIIENIFDEARGKAKTKEEFIKDAISMNCFSDEELKSLDSQIKNNSCNKEYKHLIPLGCTPKYCYDRVDFKGTKTDVLIGCKIHKGYYFEMRPDNHTTILKQTGKPAGCPKCAKNEKLDTEEFIKRAKEVHGNKYKYDKVKYTGSNERVLIGCPEHGYFLQQAITHLKGGGCPVCRESKGEKKIREILKNLGIKFEGQGKFDKCIGICKTLPFDFYLPDYKIAIEFDGKQHFEPVFGSTEEKRLERFADRKNKDRIKNNYCESHDIKLIRIAYTEINNLNTIITKTNLENTKESITYVGKNY